MVIILDFQKLQNEISLPRDSDEAQNLIKVFLKKWAVSVFNPKKKWVKLKSFDRGQNNYNDVSGR